MMSEMLGRFASCLAIALALASGCGDDETTFDPSVTGSGTGAGGTTGGSGPTSDTSADDTGVDDTGEEVEGACRAYPGTFLAEVGSFEPMRENAGAPMLGPDAPTAFNPTNICPIYLAEEQPSFVTTAELWVYRPGDLSTMDGWPEYQGLPVVVFAHANGAAITDGPPHEEHRYAHILEQLASDGAVVLALSGGGSYQQRLATMRCALEWAYTQWSEKDRLGPCVTVMGHSSGARAAHEMIVPILEDEVLDVGAVIAIAPISIDENEPLAAEHAVPYLVMQEPKDDDITTFGNLTYDRVVPEDPPGPLSSEDKVILWPYNPSGESAVVTSHYVWGGLPTVNERGRAIASFYSSRFFRWKVYGMDGNRHWFVAPTRYDADVSAFPDAIAGSAVLADFWEALYENAAYAVMGERPIMVAAFSQGVSEADGGRRLPIDTMYRENAPDSCMDPGHFTALLTGHSIDVAGFGDAGELCIGEAPEHADTHRVQLAWGDASVDDRVQWNTWGAFEDLATYAALSLRVAKIGDGAPPMSVLVRIETEDATSDDWAIAEIEYDRVIRRQPVNIGYTSRRLMHTVRFPMAEFAAQGIDLQQVRSISVRVGEAQPTGAIELDSLELTDHPLDAELRAAPASFWRCEADALEATETSCRRAPVQGACPTGASLTASVPLPNVDFDQSWAGWLVHIPGWVVDPQNPTQAELDVVRARCVRACTQEYEGNASAHVAADCAANDAFLTPYAVVADARGARQAIPSSFRDGSGIWMGQSLACDLLSSCSTEIWEDIHPAVPRRVTVAESQVGRGEKWSVELSGSITIRSEEDDTQASASLTGSMGYSPCGVDQGECPFYLGSLHLETTQTVVLDVECDSQWLQLPLGALEIDLVQPAMGIAADGDDWKGFPPRALHFQSRVESGPLVFHHTRENEEVVQLAVDGGSVRADLSGASGVVIRVQCGAQIKELEASFELESTTVLGSPPSVQIDMPSAVTCGTTVGLDAIVSDPDNDQGATRFEIDGVLMGSAVTSIRVDENHTIRAIVRDSRGATTIDTHEITCCQDHGGPCQSGADCCSPYECSMGSNLCTIPMFSG